MKKVLLFYFAIGLLISCAKQNNNSNETADTVKTNALIDEKNEAEDANANSEEDCVFNNDYKGLTEEWLKELNIHDYTWRPDLYQALILKEKDTVFLSKGGCTHFGFSVEIKLTNDNHPLTDSIFFIQKVLELATEFEMEHYKQTIEEGRIQKAGHGETNIWYEVEDDDPEDNLIYNGIEIIADGQNKKISISQYYN